MNRVIRVLKVTAFTVLGLVVFSIVLAIVLPEAEQTPPQPAATAATASQLLQNYQTQVATHNDAGARAVGNMLTSKYPDSVEAQSIGQALADLKAKMQDEFMAKQAATKEAKAKADVEANAAKAASDVAETKAKAEAAAQVKRQLAGFKKVHDEVQQVTFYYAPGVPMRSGNYFGLYLAVNDDGSPPTLRWKFQYLGDDWLFIEKLILSVDGQRMPDLDFPYGAINRDNEDGLVWESHDEAVQNGESSAVFLRLAIAKRVIVRFQGKQYYKDHILTEAEKKGMLQMLNVYTSMVKKS